jgi:hypothetical protein
MAQDERVDATRSYYGGSGRYLARTGRWVAVEELLSALEKQQFPLTRAELEAVVGSGGRNRRTPGRPHPRRRTQAHGLRFYLADADGHRFGWSSEDIVRAYSNETSRWAKLPNTMGIACRSRGLPDPGGRLRARGLGPQLGATGRAARGAGVVPARLSA